MKVQGMEVVAIDVSGSIPPFAHEAALQWVERLAEVNSNIQILAFDSSVLASFKFQPGSKPRLDYQGGGTLIGPVLDRVTQMLEEGSIIDRVIIIWDGLAYDYPLLQSFPVPIITVDVFTDEIGFPSLVGSTIH